MNHACVKVRSQRTACRTVSPTSLFTTRVLGIELRSAAFVIVTFTCGAISLTQEVTLS